MKELIFSKNVLIKKDFQYTISPAYIEITKNQISDVKKLSLISYQKILEKEKLEKNYKIHDFGALFVTPAFINCHTHIAMSFFRSVLGRRFDFRNLIENIFFKAESLLHPSDVRAFARIGAYENILNGNGLIWDHYYFGKEIAQACQETGLAAVIAPTIQDLFGPGMFYFEKAFDDTIFIDESHYFRKNGIYAAFGPHATDTVSEKTWKKILEYALEYHLPIHCHVSQSYLEYKRIYKKHKLSPIEYLEKMNILSHSPAVLLVHNIFSSKKDLRKIDLNKNALVFCPFSQLVFEFPAYVIDWENSKLKWFVATDCVATNDSMNLQRELRFLSGFPNLLNTFFFQKNFFDIKKKKFFLKKINATKKIISNYYDSHFLIHKILSGPGQFHTKFKAGVLEKGALANIIVWNTDHPGFWSSDDFIKSIAIGDTVGGIHNMCIHGKWVGKFGSFHESILKSDMYKMSISEANNRLKRLLKKL
jgi:5-methylthioadenosine/S-adenosylhomocysteine deaminase